ncbi:MAG: polysaccharide deacetylase family protein [Anaerovoracaceae bacterium]
MFKYSIIRDRKEYAKINRLVLAVEIMKRIIVPILILTLSLSLVASAPSPKVKSIDELAKSVTEAKISKLNGTTREWSWGSAIGKNRRDFTKALNYGRDLGGRYVVFTNTPKVYLTFDLGYVNQYTYELLDKLKKKRVLGVFFMTLEVVKENPKLVKRILDDGHQIGNHSSNHPNYSKISLTRMKSETIPFHKYMQKKYKYNMTLFRFPEGAYNEKSLYFLNKIGYTSLFWSFGYDDWDRNNQPGEAYALGKIMSNIKPGAVILLHGMSKTNANIIDNIINETKKKGYKIVTYEPQKLFKNQ